MRHTSLNQRPDQRSDRIQPHGFGRAVPALLHRFVSRIGRPGRILPDVGQHQTPRGPAALARDPIEIGLDRSAPGQIDEQGLPIQLHPPAVGTGKLVGEAGGVNSGAQFRVMREELLVRLGGHRSRGEYQNQQQTNGSEPRGMRDGSQYTRSPETSCRIGPVK